MAAVTAIANSATARAKAASVATGVVLPDVRLQVATATLAAIPATSVVLRVKALATSAKVVSTTASTPATNLPHPAATSLPVVISHLAETLLPVLTLHPAMTHPVVTSARRVVTLQPASLPLASPPALPSPVTVARCLCRATLKSARRATQTKYAQASSSIRPCRCGGPVRQTKRPDPSRTGRFSWPRHTVAPRGQ